jgi:hypothetical protein
LTPTPTNKGKVYPEKGPGICFDHLGIDILPSQPVVYLPLVFAEVEFKFFIKKKIIVKCHSYQ